MLTQALRTLATALERPRRRRVVIFGHHAREWTEALAAEQRFWREIPGVFEIVHAADAADLDSQPAAPPGIRTVIIPMNERHILDCPRDYWGLLPSAAAVQTLGNKKRFAEHVEQRMLGRLTPRVFASPEVAEYPCVLKRVDLLSGRGVAIARTAEELQGMLERDPWVGHEVVIQELVPGQDVVTHAISRRGRIVWSCSYRYEMAPNEILNASNGLVARPIATDPAWISAIEQLAQPFGFDGPLNADAKVTPAGAYKVLEINPRWGGSLMRPKHVEDRRAALAVYIANACWLGQPSRAASTAEA